MSPNGRRAWRKWCKSRRRKMNAHHRALYTGANMRKAQPVELGMPIPKPFTPRSLVGMTMGARKRRWARDYDALPQSGRAAKTVSMLRAYGVYPKEGNPLAQKLRPCVGCLRCQCQSAFDAWPELGEELAKDHPTCDGSGVLPARRSK